MNDWRVPGFTSTGSKRPEALFGADLPPLLHGVLWSLSLNLLTYVVLSLARQPSFKIAVQRGSWAQLPGS